MIKREATSTVLELAKGFPIVAITGPRQSGKTTLARFAFPDKPYVSLENPDWQRLATSDPRGFLNQFQEGVVLDEAQRCPELFSYLQGRVDDDARPGRYVLTGSQQFGLMAGITQSLAGRVGLLELLPFSQAELRNARPSQSLDQTLYRGAYPPIYDRDVEPRTWYANYKRTYLERDVRQLVNVRDLAPFDLFIRLCAGRTGQLVNLSQLGADCGVTHNTAKAWLSVLQASYVLFLLQPYHSNYNKRLVKTPKLYFYDTGLAAWLLGIHEPEQLRLHPMRGALFESFVVSELLKARYNRGLPGNTHFWRDRTGNEVDLLVDNPEGLRPIEIKSGETLNDDFFKGLAFWTQLAGHEGPEPMLIYGGDAQCSRKGVAVRGWRDAPWAALAGV